jgi:hypothetical protein
VSKERDTSLSYPFMALLFFFWFPLCYAGLHYFFKTVDLSEFWGYVAMYFWVLLAFSPMVFKAFVGTGRPANIVEIDVHKLPTLDSLNTAHWSADEQSQFCKAVDGIKTVDWIFTATRIRDDVTRHHLATALAFAAFSELRRRLQLASDEDLMRDNEGRRSPDDRTRNVSTC